MSTPAYLVVFSASFHILQGMLITVRVEAGEVRKQAQSEPERRQIQGEAAVLTAVAHPGVVQLVTTEGDPVDTLVLRRVGAGSVDDLRHADVEVLAGVGASLATTVADLHEIGFVHRAITGPHVLLDEQGSPVLCGFGRALGPLPGAELAAHRVEDVRAIAAILLELVPTGDRRLRSVLQAAEGGRRWSRRGDARWLARRLIEIVPGARLEGEATAHLTARLEPEEERDPLGPVGVPPDTPEAAGATTAGATSPDATSPDATSPNATSPNATSPGPTSPEPHEPGPHEPRRHEPRPHEPRPHEPRRHRPGPCRRRGIPGAAAHGDRGQFAGWRPSGRVVGPLDRLGAPPARATDNPGRATSWRPRRPVRLVRLAAGGLAAGAALVGAVALIGPGLFGSGSAPPPCPPVDQGCGRVDPAGGVITTPGGRFDLTSNAPGSILVLGRWECTDQALPAELDVRTGDVWVFDRWPGPGSRQPARLAGSIRSASGLSVRPGHGRCDLLEVRRRGHASMTIDPRAAARHS